MSAAVCHRRAMSPWQVVDGVVDGAEDIVNSGMSDSRIDLARSRFTSALIGSSVPPGVLGRYSEVLSGLGAEASTSTIPELAGASVFSQNDSVLFLEMNQFVELVTAVVRDHTSFVPLPSRCADPTLHDLMPRYATLFDHRCKNRSDPEYRRLVMDLLRQLVVFTAHFPSEVGVGSVNHIFEVVCFLLEPFPLDLVELLVSLDLPEGIRGSFLLSLFYKRICSDRFAHMYRSSVVSCSSYLSLMICCRKAISFFQFRGDSLSVQGISSIARSVPVPDDFLRFLSSRPSVLYGDSASSSRRKVQVPPRSQLGSILLDEVSQDVLSNLRSVMLDWLSSESDVEFSASPSDVDVGSIQQIKMNPGSEEEDVDIEWMSEDESKTETGDITDLLSTGRMPSEHEIASAQRGVDVLYPAQPQTPPRDATRALDPPRTASTIRHSSSFPHSPHSTPYSKDGSIDVGEEDDIDVSAHPLAELTKKSVAKDLRKRKTAMVGVPDLPKRRKTIQSTAEISGTPPRVRSRRRSPQDATLDSDGELKTPKRAPKKSAPQTIAGPSRRVLRPRK